MKMGFLKMTHSVASNGEAHREVMVTGLAQNGLNGFSDFYVLDQTLKKKKSYSSGPGPTYQ